MEVLKGIPFTFGCLDILLLVFGENNEKYLKYLRIVFDTLRTADLKFERTKWCFYKCNLHYIGHFISGKDVYPLHETLQNIKDLQVQKHSKKVGKWYV